MDIMLGLGISTPAEWVQQPVIDETTLKLASEVRSTSYANFGICRQPSGAAATSLEDHPGPKLWRGPLPKSLSGMQLIPRRPRPGICCIIREKKGMTLNVLFKRHY